MKNYIIYSLILLQTYTNINISLFSAEVDGDQEIANFKNIIFLLWEQTQMYIFT